MNAFLQLLRATGHHSPIGTWISSTNPIVAEALGHAGFDWGVVDMEHSPLDLMPMLQLLQALGNTRMLGVVRVPQQAQAPVRQLHGLRRQHAGDATRPAHTARFSRHLGDVRDDDARAPRGGLLGQLRIEPLRFVLVRRRLHAAQASQHVG